MDYKITVERIEPLQDEQKYNDTTKLYEQRFRLVPDIQIAENAMLVKIIAAVNK